jgi:hypothetical protein
MTSIYAYTNNLVIHLDWLYLHSASRISDKTSEPSFIEEDMEIVEDTVEDDGLGSERRSESEENVAPQTPTRSQKRRRLEELAAARSGKKRKR